MIELTCIIYFIFIIYNFDKLYRFNSIKLHGLVRNVHCKFYAHHRQKENITDE